jgi:hypothetical protein
MDPGCTAGTQRLLPALLITVWREIQGPGETQSVFCLLTSMAYLEYPCCLDQMISEVISVEYITTSK